MSSSSAKIDSGRIDSSVKACIHDDAGSARSSSSTILSTGSRWFDRNERWRRTAGAVRCGAAGGTGIAETREWFAARVMRHATKRDAGFNMLARLASKGSVEERKEQS